MKKKTFAMLLSLVLVVGCVIGGTIAWLTAQTAEVKNTFTYGDVNIGLAEKTGNEYTIIPGKDIDKDPTVTVDANSEACWLFVKVKEEGTFVKDKVTYSIDDGWTLLTGVEDVVYYREVSADEAENGVSYPVLTDNKIFVSDTLTKDDLKNITSNPTLTFTAYAIQKDGIEDASTAWAKIPNK